MAETILTSTFLVTYFLFPIVLYAVLRMGGIDLLKFSIESFVILNCLAFGYVGIIALYFELDPLRVSQGVRGGEIILLTLAASSWAIFSLGLGFIAVRASVPAALRHSKFEGARELTPFEFYAVLGMLGLCAAVLVIYLYRVDAVAIWSIFSDDAELVAFQRSQSGNDFGGKYHRYRVFTRELISGVTFILFAHWLINRRMESLFFFLVSFSITAFSSVSNAEKAPIVVLLIALLLVYIAVRGRGFYINIYFVLLIAIGIMLISVLYLYGHGVRDVGTALNLVFSRAFTGQIVPAIVYLSYFPEIEDFLLGRSFPNPGGMLGFEPYRLTVTISEWFFPQNVQRGIVGTMPTMFWGEIYANFGFWGVAIVPLFVGIWVAFIATLVRALPRSALSIGVAVWLATHFAKLAGTGVSKFVVDFDLIVVSTTIAAFVLLAKLAERQLAGSGLEKNSASN